MSDCLSAEFGEQIVKKLFSFCQNVSVRHVRGCQSAGATATPYEIDAHKDPGNEDLLAINARVG